jgi:hypothetical protein
MSLNFLKVGRPIAKIKGGKYDGKIIYVDSDIKTANNNDEDKIEGIPTFNKLKLPSDAKFQPIPDNKKERDCHYISGVSGSGKSTWTKKFVKEYMNTHNNKNPVYLFSRKNEDENLDDVKPKRIKIGENLLMDPLSMEDFKNSLVLFDDTDIIKPRQLRDVVDHIRDEILQGGRSIGVSCIITNHNFTGRELKTVLNECHAITVFPANYNRGMKYLFSDYLGLDKTTINKIRKAPSRWVTIYKNFPMVILTENEIWLAVNDID